MIFYCFPDIIATEEAKTKQEKYDTHGSITITTTPEDDDIAYTCEAKHPAISINRPMRAMTKLSVFCKFTWRKWNIQNLLALY